MTELVIDVPGLPVPWARAGRNKGFTFTPKKQRGAMADLKTFASRAMAGRKLFDRALIVRYVFVWPYPRSMSAKKRRDTGWRASRPDIDNLIKLCSDALNGIVWTDDAIIVEATAAKLYGDEAHTRLVVREI